MQNGTLGYSGSYHVIDQVSGTLTSGRTVGDVVRAGKVLYRVGGVPVVLLKGSTPAYRELSWGDSGADVRQLNAALVALGYAKKSDLDPTDDYFGRPTWYALRRLQDAVGLEVTGTLTLGEAVFLPGGEIRITAVDAVPGAAVAPNQSIMTASSTTRQVSVSLSAGQQTVVAKGDAVTITLPSGRTTPGTVSSVGKIATKAADGSTTIDVLITPTKPAETGSLDQAPVQVTITADTVKDVLSVPVNALLALAGGGYAVEVSDTAGTRGLVPVKVGVFDDSEGRVEVSGNGLAEGQNVVVPAS
jgi:peptidoglycan hydrolase-like protein with peptidoglycan-binding domain